MSEESKFELTREDFISSGWQTVAESIEKKESHYYSSAFYSKFNETNDEKIKEIFLLLATLMSSRLKLDSPDNPFANVDKFNDDHLKFFAEIIDEITDDEIKSRMADVLWLRNKNHKMAELAVESYLESAKTLEDFEHWTQTQRRIERALQLGSMLGKKRELYQKVLGRIFNLLDICNGEDPYYLSAQLMRLLQERREGDAKKYAPFCEKLAIKSETQNDFHKARIYWETKAGWHYQDKDNDSARDARIKIAESYEKESDFNLENRQPKYLMASHPIEKAIVAYRNVGNCEVKIEELKLKLREYLSKGTKEMIPISGGSVDITDIVISTEKTISSKSFVEALELLILLLPPNNVKRIRKQVERNRKKFIGQSLFPNKLFSSSGLSVGVQASQGEEAILADMFNYATYNYEITVKSLIEPARNIILTEHSARVFEIYELLMDHPFIPQNREFIVARGLQAGLNGDFLTALHLLIPQIEESIRYILIHSGIAPSSFKADGTQDEHNLNQFLREPKYTKKLNEILGEDFMFDLRCSLIERFGANLRNNMAHGLMDFHGFYSYASIYLWWLALRFYLLPIILNKESKTEIENEKSESE